MHSIEVLKLFHDKMLAKSAKNIRWKKEEKKADFQLFSKQYLLSCIDTVENR